MYEEEDVKKEEDRLARLASFAATIVEKRKEAVDGRKMSGIETLWQEDEEYYDGIDDANRHEVMLKPATSSGRVTTARNVDRDITKSTAFVNITQPYVDMASARVADMLLPTDDKPFALKPTPIPEVAEFTENNEDLMPDQKMSVGEAAKEFIEEMSKKAEKAETQIWDWMVESRWHGEFRKVIEQAAKIGSSCLKGPVPVKRNKRVMNKREDGVIELQIESELKPASKMVDVWNIYPDPSCGESIHNGRYIFEKDYISARQLRELKGTGYIDSEIDEVLKEGPGKRNSESNRFDFVKDTEMFEIWYFTGQANSEDMESAGCECDEDTIIPVQVTLVNDRIVKASASISESGDFPYDIMLWQRRANSWAGTGVARQTRTAQNMVNASARNLMDNAGTSAGPQIVMRDGIVYPADGEWTITPLKIWRVDEAADLQSVRDAITPIIIPTMQAELERIIKMALEFAERATSMPLLLQGQQGASTDTVGGMQILQANASTVLRRIAKISDDNVTEPHVLRYYEWLMLYGDNDEMKGDYTVEALGSTAFYERDAQAQMIMQMLPMANDPEFKLSKERLMSEILKSNKISPERVQMTEEEWSELQQKMQQQPADPKVEAQKAVAQMKVEGDMEKAKLVQQSDMNEIAAKQQSMQNEMALKLQMMQMEHEHQEKIERMKHEVKMMELSQAQQISLDSIKAALASDTMKLKTQKELSLMNKKPKQVSMPETEPVGKAAAGHAYEQ